MTEQGAPSGRDRGPSDRRAAGQPRSGAKPQRTDRSPVQRPDRPPPSRPEKDRSARSKPVYRGEGRGTGPDRDRGLPEANRRTDGRSVPERRSGSRGQPLRGQGVGRDVTRSTAPRVPREAPRPGLARKPDEPAVPTDVDLRLLPRGVRAELRGLPKDLGDIVGAHLLMAGQTIDDDPALAYAHAEAARRRAARLPIAREAAAETAYAAGMWEVALSEYRALRRMVGTQDFLPVMADCERALGRPQAALKLAKDSHRYGLDPALRVEMVMVEAGARSDLGQHAEALRVLAQAIESSDGATDGARARLRYAYADALLGHGRDADARSWFAEAARLDAEGDTDAQDRLDALDGLVITYNDDDDDQ